mmetsp:Transcript_7194/g.21985  ORF Transcript_7194/g.21985 Transcript_7194/m.21985 type:complete len:317 (+) Transcript_7194:485-1435(+)
MSGLSLATWCACSSCHDFSRKRTEVESWSHASSFWHAALIRGSMWPEANSSRAIAAPTGTSTLEERVCSASLCRYVAKSSPSLETGTAEELWQRCRVSASGPSAQPVSAATSSGATCRTSARAEAALSASTAARRPKARNARVCAERAFAFVQPSGAPISCSCCCCCTSSSSRRSTSTSAASASSVMPYAPWKTSCSSSPRSSRWESTGRQDSPETCILLRGVSFGHVKYSETSTLCALRPNGRTPFSGSCMRIGSIPTPGSVLASKARMPMANSRCTTRVERAKMATIPVAPWTGPSTSLYGITSPVTVPRPMCV